MQLLKKMRSREGFTLVELIVVIMIIGILAATLLPKIMRAPARARDAGRIKTLENIENALNSYYRSNRAFPSTAGCLNTTAAPGTDLTGTYIKSSDFPSDPSANSLIDYDNAGTTCTGQFYYQPLTKSGLSNNSYMLIANVELDENGNAAAQDFTALASVADVEAVLTTSGTYYVKIGGA